jgi:chorismate mutase-like protein
MTEEQARQALAEWRVKIDEVDLQLLELLNARTRIVEEIGRIKSECGLPIYEPKREDQVFENVTRHNGGPMPSEAVRRVFERIIDEMRTLQRMRKEK